MQSAKCSFVDVGQFARRLPCAHVMCQSCCEGILRKSWRPKCPICQLATSRRQIKEDPKIARISAAVAELARTNEKSIEASHDADEGKQQQAAPHGHHGRKRKQPHSEQSSEEHSAKAGFHEDKENEGGKTTRASQRLQGKEWPCSMCTFVNPSHRRMCARRNWNPVCHDDSWIG